MSAASRTLTICNSRCGFLWKKKWRCEGQFSVRSCAKLLLRLVQWRWLSVARKNAKKVLHPLTLSTLYIYVAWPRLNVCLTSLPSLLRQSLLCLTLFWGSVPFPCIDRFFLNSTFHTRSTCTWLSGPQKTQRCNRPLRAPVQLKCDGYIYIYIYRRDVTTLHD